ncbi:hypothetical protein NBRC116593_28670 [Sulfitobacter pacificus]
MMGRSKGLAPLAAMGGQSIELEAQERMNRVKEVAQNENTSEAANE